VNILWHSNATWMPSGYGTQSRIWTHRLKEAGYGVVVSAYRGLEGSPLADAAGIVHLPRVKEQHGNDVIYGHYLYAQTYFPNHQRTSVIWSLIDIFAMRPDLWMPLPWAAWCPVDCEPILQNERAQFNACRWPIAISRHGEAQMKEIGLKPLYVPHGIETEVFKPTDRSQARKNMFTKNLIDQVIPDDAFLVVIVANNGEGGRKNFAGMFEAFQLFSHDHPDALLYVHADPSGVHGHPIDAMAAQLGIADKVIFPGGNHLLVDGDGNGSLRSLGTYMMVTGIPTDDHLVDVYNAADVKLMLSYGEGFGLTDVEAQACGCPLIAIDFAASSEINLTGWKVSGIRFQPERIPRSYQMLADPYDAADCLAHAYSIWKAGEMPELRERTRKAALVYDVETVLKDHFIPVLNEIDAQLKAEPHAEWLRKKTEPEKVAPIWDKKRVLQEIKKTENL